MAIITVQSTTIGDGKGGKIDLSVKYWKILTVLMSKKVALINATVENRNEIDAGTAYYYVTKRNITQDYLNGKGPNDETAVRSVQVLLDKPKEINFEIETLDLKRLGAKLENGQVIVADSLVSQWVDAKAKSTETYMVAKLLQLAMKAIGENITKITLPENPTVNDYREKVWKVIVNKLADLKQLVTDEYIGTDEEDYYLWMSPKFKNIILLATANLGSEYSTARLIDGNVTEIGGIKTVECTFLGKDFPAGVLDKQEKFEFKGRDAVLVHKETVAFPFNKGQENTFILQGNGNIKNFHKFLVNKDGGEVLRPELAWGFSYDDGSTPVTPEIKTDKEDLTINGAVRNRRNN